MKEFSILDAEVGKPDDGIRELEIIGMHVDTINFKGRGNEGDRAAEKVFLQCRTLDGEREFQISEAWSETRRGEKKVQGLWVQLDGNKQLIANSTLGQLIRHLGVTKVSALQGMKVTGYPDPKGYLVLSAYEMEPAAEEESLFS